MYRLNHSLHVEGHSPVPFIGSIVSLPLSMLYLCSENFRFILHFCYYYLLLFLIVYVLLLWVTRFHCVSLVGLDLTTDQTDLKAHRGLPASVSQVLG